MLLRSFALTVCAGRLIERVWQEPGFTAILVTHEVEEAVALADRIIVLADGAVALGLRVDLPCPRGHTSHGFTEIKKIVLDTVMGVRHGDASRAHALGKPEEIAEAVQPRLVRTA